LLKLNVVKLGIIITLALNIIIIMVIYSTKSSDSGDSSTSLRIWCDQKSWQYSEGSQNNTFSSIPPLASEKQIFKNYH